MAKPDYATLLGQIAAETDPTAKQALIDECYVFLEPLTEAEEDLFGYVPRNYYENNPGTDDDGNFISYIGVYYNQAGANTG
tara:strand:+ start:32 stop:274 length:243 start_codon:yes stop_codon:yes gene_type:complete